MRPIAMSQICRQRRCARCPTIAAQMEQARHAALGEALDSSIGVRCLAGRGPDGVRHVDLQRWSPADSLLRITALSCAGGGPRSSTANRCAV